MNHFAEYLQNPLVAELIEASNDGFWDWNIVTSEVYFSRRWCEMLGYKQHEIELHVKSWEKLVHPDDMPHVMEVLNAHLEGKTEHYETEHRVRCKNGEWKWILDRGRVISRDINGKPLRATGSHTDITDKKMREVEKMEGLIKEAKAKKELEEVNIKLQQAVNIRTQFLSIASHELKTPLTSLSLLNQSMKKNFSFPPEKLPIDQMKVLIERTERQITKLMNLVDEMLDITRIEAGKLEIQKDPCDLVAIIHEVIERMNPLIVTKNQSPLILNLPEKCDGVWDANRLEQVIMNLLTNALKYGRGGEIELKLIISHQEVVLSVKDHGIGIAAADQNRIFDCFERAASLSEVSGLGLGLFITKQIVEAHGGALSVESQQGIGSTFFVKLPRS